MATDRPVRVGFIGCGRLASRVHYPSLSELPGADLVAIADLEAERLNTIGDTYQIPGSQRYPDHRRLLEHADCEAVYVIMDPGPATAVVVDCLDAGKHVFMEKPPGLNLEATERIEEAARRAGRMVQVAWNRRFAPVIREAATRLHAIGAPTMVMGEFHKAHPAPEPFCGTGSWLVVDQAHALDAMCFLAGGDPSSATPLLRRLREYNDCNLALLTWESGCIGHFASNYVSGARVERFELHVQDAGAYMSAPEEALIYRAGRTEPERLSGFELAGSDSYHRTYGYYQESEHFLSCVRTGATPETDIGHALRLMRLITGMEQGSRRDVERVAT